MVAGHQDNIKIGAIIQARMQSIRLPGKILLPLPFNSTEVLLSWPVKRLQKSKLIKKIILATSTNKENDVLKDFSAEHDIFFYAGSEQNVLSRFIEAANIYGLDIIVRVTGDNPIIDEGLIDQLTGLHIKGNFDYSYSDNLPVGMNVEVITTAALKEIAARKDLIQPDEEHVTHFFKRQNLYSVYKHEFEFKTNIAMRLTLDYAADYAMLNIVAEVSKKNNLYGIGLIKFIENNYSWVFNINARFFQKKQYKSLEEELVDSINILNEYEFRFTHDFLKKKLNEA